MIPDYVKNLFKPRTQGRIGRMGPIQVSGALEDELNSMVPGDVLEMTGRDSGRQYSVVLREDLQHVLDLARIRIRK